MDMMKCVAQRSKEVPLCLERLEKKLASGDPVMIPNKICIECAFNTPEKCVVRQQFIEFLRGEKK